MSGELSDREQQEFERRVERYKEQGRQTAQQLVQQANPKAQVYPAGNVGDQPWDLADSKYFSQMPSTQVKRIEAGGHHVVALKDGAIGLKLDGLDLQSNDLEKTTTKFRRALLKRCSQMNTKRGVGVVVMDIDDTLLRAPDGSKDPDDMMVQVEPVVQILHDIVDHPKLRDLARHWGCKRQMPDHRIVPFIVTARPYSLEDMQMCVHELLHAGVRLPRAQCLFMRPPEVHEVESGTL
jgi:hypothetical protein